MSTVLTTMKQAWGWVRGKTDDLEKDLLSGFDAAVQKALRSVLYAIGNAALRAMFIRFVRFIKTYWFELAVVLAPEYARTLALARMAIETFMPERHAGFEIGEMFADLFFGSRPKCIISIVKDISAIFTFAKGPGKTAVAVFQSLLFRFAKFMHYLLGDVTNPLLIKLRNAFDCTSSPEFESYVSKVTGIYNGNIDQFKSEPQLVAQLPVFIGVGNGLSAKARQEEKQMKEASLNTAVAKLIEIQAALEARKISGNRVEPAHLFLAGPAGIGKSTAARVMARRLVAAVLRDTTGVTEKSSDELDKYIFVRHPSKFWQGFSATHIVVIYDDLWTSPDAQVRDREMTEYQQCIGTGAFFPDQAELTDKRTPFNAQFMIVCSNTVFPVASDRAASLRRISPHVMCSGPALNNVANPDVVSFTHMQFDVAQNLSSAPELNLKVPNDQIPRGFNHQRTTFSDLVNMMYQNWLRQTALKENVILADADIPVRHGDDLMEELICEFEDALDTSRSELNRFLKRAYAKHTPLFDRVCDFVRKNLSWLIGLWCAASAVYMFVHWVYAWFNKKPAEYHVLDLDDWDMERQYDAADWAECEDRPCKTMFETEESPGKYRNKRRPARHGSLDAGLKRLLHSVGRISVESMQGCVFFPGGRMAVCPWHFFKKYRDMGVAKVNVGVEYSDGLKLMSFVQQVRIDDVKFDAGHDICWFELVKLENRRRNFLVGELKDAKDLCVCVVNDNACSFVPVSKIRVGEVKFRDGISTWVITTTRVSAWDRGDCGDLLLGQVNGCYRAIGMYVGATAENSFFVPLIDVEPKFCPPERHGLEGLENTFVFDEQLECFEPTMLQRARNDLVLSTLERVGCTPGEMTKFPADLSQEAEDKAMKKKDAVTYLVDRDRLDEARDYLRNELRNKIEPCVTLSLEEALSGRTPRGDLASLFSDASPGVPFKTWPEVKKEGRKALFDGERQFKGRALPIPTLKFQEQIDSCWEAWEDSQLYGNVFTEAMKVEKRPADRVLEKKTRIFSASPLTAVVNGRRAIGDFYLQFSSTRVMNALGIAPQTLEWNDLALRALEQADVFGAFDYSGFDATIPAEFLRAAEEIVSSFYPPDQRKYVRASWEENSAGVCALHGQLFQARQGNRSGYAFTTMVNCLVNLLNYAYCKLVVYPGQNPFGTGFVEVFGDDFFYGDRKCMKFTPRVFAEEAAKIGFKMTPPNKKSELVGAGWMQIHEVEFLQRGFVQGENPDVPAVLFLGPLSKETICNSLKTRRRGATIEDEAMTLVNALSEACLHSEAFALEIVRSVSRATDERSKRIVKAADCHTVIGRTMARLRCKRVEDVKFPHTLSNFTPCELTVKYKGRTLCVPTVEHAYQAIKLLYHEKELEVDMMEWSAMKVHTRCEGIQSSAWNFEKRAIMKVLLKERALVDMSFRNSLTRGVEYLHNVPDLFWGSARGGQNVFGHLLMELAFEIPGVKDA